MQYQKGKHCTKKASTAHFITDIHRLARHVCMPEKDMVWSTKYRFKVLRGDIQLRTREIIRRICAENGVDIINGVVSNDHVHLFISILPKIFMSDLMRKIKGRFSYLIQREFPALKKRYWGRGF